MKIKYSFISEAANVSQSGNLNVLGIFQNINATSFPTKFTKMVYVACIEFHRSESGNHKFKLNFIDDDGKQVIPVVEGDLYVSEDSNYSNLLLSFENIQFNSPGTYAMDLLIDNHHISTDIINVYKV